MAQTWIWRCWLQRMETPCERWSRSWTMCQRTIKNWKCGNQWAWLKLMLQHSFLKPQCWGHSDGCMEWRYPISVIPVFWERNRNIRDVELNRFTLAQCSTTDSKCECKTWNHSRALQLLLTRLFPQSFYSCFDDKRCFLLTYIHVQDGTNPILLLLQNCQNIIKYLGYIKSECWTEYDRMQLAGCHHVLEPFLS